MSVTAVAHAVARFACAVTLVSLCQPASVTSPDESATRLTSLPRPAPRQPPTIPVRPPITTQRSLIPDTSGIRRRSRYKGVRVGGV